MSRIQTKLAQLKSEGRKALIPYVTAGFPYADITPELMHAMVAAGSDVIELGVPFSDPMADGPVIQKAGEKALSFGIGTAQVLAMVKAFRQTDSTTPVVLMGYANPVEAYNLKHGADSFIRDAAAAGVDGVLIVDYPPEECEQFAATLKAHGLDLIFLLAPTSTPERMDLVGRLASGYVYYVSLKGVTGAGNLDTGAVEAMLTYEFLGTSSVQRQYAHAKIASRERTNEEFSQTLAAMPLQFQPGSVWAYSRATDVLGRLVEVVSGQSLGAFLQAEIFGPLGMVDTGFAVPPEQQHRIADPFAHDPDGGVPMKVLEPRQVPAMEGGGGGLMSTAMDYTRFLQFLRNRGELNGVRLLGPHTVDFMTADHLGSIPADGTLLPPGHGFGLGFAVRTHLGLSPVPGSVGLYYWGGIAGTTFFVDPMLDMYAMLMVQAPNQRDYYRPLFRDLVYAALV